MVISRKTPKLRIPIPSELTCTSTSTHPGTRSKKTRDHRRVSESVCLRCLFTLPSPTELDQYRGYHLINAVGPLTFLRGKAVREFVT